MSEPAPRATSGAAFWDERYRAAEAAFGLAPTPLVEAWADRFAPGARVVDVGAGEGRNALFLATRGVRTAALDFATEGLKKAAERAAADGLTLDVVEQDVRDWQPEAGAWDGVVCVFTHLLPDERAGFYQTVIRALRPGGLLVAEWFTPEQLGYRSGGPSVPDRLVAPEELEAAFGGAGRVLLGESGERVLDDGPFLQGPAATVRFVFERGT